MHSPSRGSFPIHPIWRKPERALQRQGSSVRARTEVRAPTPTPNAGGGQAGNKTERADILLCVPALERVHAVVVIVVSD